MASISWYPPREMTDYLKLDVSKNMGTPKSSILIGFSIINHPFWGTPSFWKHLTAFLKMMFLFPRWYMESFPGENFAMIWLFSCQHLRWISTTYTRLFEGMELMEPWMNWTPKRIGWFFFQWNELLLRNHDLSLGILLGISQVSEVLADFFLHRCKLMGRLPSKN